MFWYASMTLILQGKKLVHETRQKKRVSYITGRRLEGRIFFSLPLRPACYGARKLMVLSVLAGCFGTFSIVHNNKVQVLHPTTDGAANPNMFNVKRNN